MADPNEGRNRPKGEPASEASATGLGPSPQDVLRVKAEALASDDSKEALLVSVESMSPLEVMELVHSLRVHQIELELQNEQLLEAQLMLHAARANYLQLYDMAPVAYCVISDDGLILQANLTAVTLLEAGRDAIEGEPWTRWIAAASQDAYYLFRKAVTRTGGPRSCELHMVRRDKTEFLAHLTATSSSNAEGKPVLRVVVSDITSLAEVLREQEDPDNGPLEN